MQIRLSKRLWAEAGLSRGWFKEAAARKCVRCGHLMQRHPDQVGHKDILQCPHCFLDYSPYAESGQLADYNPQTGEIKMGPTGKIFPASEWLNQRAGAKTAQEAGQTPEVSYEEGKGLGLSRQDIDRYNALQDMAKMIREHRALSPEQKVQKWKEIVEKEAIRLGHYPVSGLFGDNDYQIVLRKAQGGGWEASYSDFKSWGSQKPDLPKARLGKPIARFASLDEAYKWITEQFQKKQVSQEPPSAQEPPSQA
jgi:hypothetical protein